MQYNKHYVLPKNVEFATQKCSDLSLFFNPSVCANKSIIWWNCFSNSNTLITLYVLNTIAEVLSEQSI